MKKISYKGYRFPPEIIQQAIWLYVRFTLSFRDVEDLLAERGIMVSYETVRRWVNHFGPMIAANLRKRRPKPYTTWHLDEVYLKTARCRRSLVSLASETTGASHGIATASRADHGFAPRPLIR
jgi:transposase-like protein